MDAPAPRRDKLALLLQLVTIGLLVALLVRTRASDGAGEGDEPQSFEELASEITAARYKLDEQANRLTRLLDRLSRGGTLAGGDDPGAGGGHANAKLDETASPSLLLEELARVTDVIERYKWDPLQREPLEKERGRLEDLLRRAGDDTIDMIDAFFSTIGERLKEATPTWMQTRLLTHVVEPIGTDDAYRFARSVFDNPGFNSGVRLKAADVALKRWPDEMSVKLIELLENPDPTFSRPEQIALYFKTHKDDRAIPALIAAATDIDRDRTLRRFALEALGIYDDPRVIEALKKVAAEDVHGDLRGVAIVGLNDLLGKDVVGFIHFLRERMNPEDPMHRLLDNTEALWTGEDGD